MQLHSGTIASQDVEGGAAPTRHISLGSALVSVAPITITTAQEQQHTAQLPRNLV